MKTSIGFWFATFILVVGFSAQAAQIPGLERPYTEGRLLEIADGHEINSGFEKTVSFAGVTESQVPTAIEITEEKKTPCKDLPCGPAFQKTDFVITKKMPADCGSVKYEGHEQSHQPGTVNRTIEVLDHSTRRCDDKDYQWELILKEQGHHTRYLVGTAE